jgi:hypothetical protein
MQKAELSNIEKHLLSIIRNQIVKNPPSFGESSIHICWRDGNMARVVVTTERSEMPPFKEDGNGI